MVLKKRFTLLLGTLCVAAIAGGGLACGDESAPAPQILSFDDLGQPAASGSEFELRNTMRRLWMDQVVWTRMVIIDVVARRYSSGSVARLLQSQTELGNALMPFYGKAVGKALTERLHAHVTLAAEVLTAAGAGNTGALTDGRARWSANADQLAELLAGVNPHWPLADLRTMLRLHLEGTLAEATARLSGDFAGDIKAYDAVASQILELADVLAAGIARQFPDRVRRSTMTASNEELHRAMRRLWLDHVVWTRVYLLAAFARRADADPAAGRLLQNVVELGKAIVPFYGKEAGAALTRLLHEHVVIATSIVSAAMAGDSAELAGAKARWNANADQIAELLAAANPHWPLAALETMMRLHLEQTLSQANAMLRRDPASDIRAYDAVAAHILQLADALSDGIAKQLPGLLL